MVPLSWKRRLQRGYNQSQLIAEIISSILQIKIESRILYKTKNIVPQSTLNKKERKENILADEALMPAWIRNITRKAYE